MIELVEAGYRYPGGAAVGPVSLRVAPGELVVLAGPTGCGKSTVLRLAAGLLGRHGQGTLTGEVRVGGTDPARAAPHERVRRLGFVGQDPDDPILAGTALDEVAFAAESAGFTPEEVERRAREALAGVGLAGFEARAPRLLSGGEKQRLAIASALSAGAGVLLLDEPLAQLDPHGAVDVVRRLRDLADQGVAVLLVEHRLRLCAPVADRVVWLADGRVAGAPVGVGAPLGEVPRAPHRSPGIAPVRSLRGAGHAYVAGVPALTGVDLDVFPGDRIAVVGHNGAGKSALLAALRGEGVVGVPQNPDLGLFCETVRDELAYGPRERGLGEAHLGAVAVALGVEGLLDRPPQALSRGQRMRVAVAAALACRPALLLLDEPTSGQDEPQVERLFAGVAGHLPGAVVFATHDLALAGRWATRVVVVRAGRVVGEVDPAALSPEHVAPGSGGPAGPGTVPAIVGAVGGPGPAEPGSPEVGPPRLAGAAMTDPRARIVAVLLLGVLLLCLEGAPALGVLTALALGRLVLARQFARWVNRALVGAAALTWGTMLSQGLFYADLPRTPLVGLGPLTLWEEGVVYGLVQSLRFLALLGFGLHLAVTTPPDRLVAGLRGLRVPFGLTVMGVAVVSFVPVVLGEWLAVRAARAERGRTAWRRAPWAWVALELALLRPVLARSLRRARALAESLDARGFHPLAPRGVRSPLRFTVGDALGLGGVALLTAAAFLLRLAYLAYGAEIYYHPDLRPLYAFVRAWM